MLEFVFVKVIDEQARFGLIAEHNIQKPIPRVMDLNDHDREAANEHL
jgi:hypothetical protein